MDKTLSEAAKLIASSHTLVLTTHVLPDGDGLGAEIALYHYLRALGKDVRVINPDAIPERYRFIDTNQIIEIANGKMKPLAKPVDLWMVVDTNDPLRVGTLWDAMKRHSRDILFLDHHPKNGDHGSETTQLRIHTVVDEKSSSIGELLYRLFHQAHDILDGKNLSFKLTPEIALGLYVSVMTDTNSFRYARTTALSHRIAADLIDYGLQPEEIYQNVYSSKSIDHLRLIGEVLSQVQSKGNVVWVEITRKIREKYGATSDDTQTIINFLLLIKDAELLVLLREEDDGRIKASIKSKGAIKVNHVAQEFGGGGHEFAAGFITQGSLRTVQKKLIARLFNLR